MNNTIILLVGEAFLTTREDCKCFAKGDTIWGEGGTHRLQALPGEIMRWSIDDEDKALEELSKHRCHYDSDGYTAVITEYALEFCETDADGAFISGSDYELAPEDMWYVVLGDYDATQGTGSFDFDEAVEMALANGCSFVTGAHIDVRGGICGARGAELYHVGGDVAGGIHVSQVD